MKTLKQLIVLSLLTVLSGDVFSQGGVLTPPAFPDQIYMKENTRTRRVIPYAHLREADVMWSKRVWRTIDLREKINHPLYFPTTPIQDRKSLFDVIKLALSEGRLDAFDNPALDDEFKVVMSKSQIDAMFVQWDSTATTPDPNNPDVMIPAPVKTEVTSVDIKQYWIKEDWFFDRQRSVLDVRIIGLCPLKEKKSEAGEVVGYSPMFWIYFPAARQIFANTEVFNRANDAERRTLEDIFWKRQFGSYIHKESNVYDRTIQEYKQGLNALLESERIKEDIFNLEHDLWHF